MVSAATRAVLTDEQRQLRATAREFAERELEPHAEGWDRGREFPREALAELAELGFLGLLVPEEEGGSGFDTTGFCLAVEEVSRAVPALGLLLSTHNGPVCRLVREAGSAGARARWLPRLASGEILGAFALTEAGAGSDMSAVRARYAPADGGFLVDGVKEWVTGAGVAGLAVVFARGETETRGGDGAAAGPLGAFLVDLSSEGVRSGPLEETMGLRAAPVGRLTLEGVRVADGDRLGAEGAGFALAQEALALGRLGIAAQSLGIAGRCIDLAVAYAKERRQFGRPIAEFQGVRLPLAELAARLEGARALVYRTAAERAAAELGGEGLEPPRAETRVRGNAPSAGAPEADGGGWRPSPLAVRAAMAKLVASDLAMAAALQAVQAHGGYGYVKDYPVERFFRDAKACQLYEGTNEIQRVVIAKGLFGD